MSQVPTDEFGRPRYLPSGKKNPNYGKDNPGEGSDWAADLGRAITPPKQSRPTTRSRQQGSEGPHVYVNGERFGTVASVKKWLDRNAAGAGPPPGMGGFIRFQGASQGYTWDENRPSGPPAGQIAFYPDDWAKVGIFVRYDPADFGVKGKPYWIHLTAPTGAGPGRHTPWQAPAQTVTPHETGWPTHEETEKAKWGNVPPTMKPFH